ncbi:uncharacterized protein LOC110854398 [Folsomia candida]|uniref:uncharacterized protein LOC110854398 n=1 Tax=Folsomia candida TaxID=158441 RepID=UPI001604B28B|nr:uncharacterized protein LOC110854398 [Folsomia candida]XP_035710997.1 uncharacterized protein LOC110854398 [Folsomia candida]
MLSAVGTRGGGPLAGGIDRNITTNITRNFECHSDSERHGTLLISLAGAGVLANLSLAGLVIARRSLRRWSSGLLLHGTIVDGTRAALLIPLGLSVLRCQPITRCSFLDTAFLLLATVTSLNLLVASLSDAPLLPPPLLVPSLIQSAGYSRAESQYTSPLYPKGEYSSYHSEYYDDDANLLAETTAMPDSPQCLVFGVFITWFAALTINLGPTFLSGALAAQADTTPTAPSCPLVRGPARHAVLNALWAAVNLLAVFLASAHLRKLKKDLARARMGLLAAAGCGIAGMAGIMQNKQSSSLSQNATTHGSKIPMATVATCGGQTSTLTSHLPHHRSGGGSLATAGELDVLIREAQKNGRCHIRTLSTLAVINLVCWVPLYVVALVAPVGNEQKGTWEDPAPIAYEFTLLAAFAHSILHPLFLLLLHHPLRQGLKHCLIEGCCFICLWLGMDFGIPVSPGGGESSGSMMERGIRRRSQHHELNIDNHHVHAFPGSSRPHSRSHSPHSQVVLHHSAGDLVHIPGSASLLKMKRSVSLKSDRLLVSTGCRNGGPPSPPLILTDDMLPPPPLPPASSAFRKQMSMDDLSPTSEDNRWPDRF